MQRSRARAVDCAQVLCQHFMMWSDLLSVSTLQIANCRADTTVVPVAVLIMGSKRHGQYCRALTMSHIISHLLFLDSLI